jgi:hypothetical protein
MSKMQGHPTDAMIAARMGEMEMTRIRMAWMLEQQDIHIKVLSQRLGEQQALLAAKDDEIKRLTELADSPTLPLDPPAPAVH